MKKLLETFKDRIDMYADAFSRMEGRERLNAKPKKEEK